MTKRQIDILMVTPCYADGYECSPNNMFKRNPDGKIVFSADGDPNKMFISQVFQAVAIEFLVAVSRKHENSGRFFPCCLRSTTLTQPDDNSIRIFTEQIYVHNKLAISDNRIAIGSANMNGRSLSGSKTVDDYRSDTEVLSYFEPTAHVRDDFLCRLLCEHIGERTLLDFFYRNGQMNAVSFDNKQWIRSMFIPAALTSLFRYQQLLMSLEITALIPELAISPDNLLEQHKDSPKPGLLAPMTVVLTQEMKHSVELFLSHVSGHVLPFNWLWLYKHDESSQFIPPTVEPTDEVEREIQAISDIITLPRLSFLQLLPWHQQFVQHVGTQLRKNAYPSEIFDEIPRKFGISSQLRMTFFTAMLQFGDISVDRELLNNALLSTSAYGTIKNLTVAL